MTYDRAFYDTIRPGTQASAAVLVPIVMDLLHPDTVVDVGCGEGWWAQAFADQGCQVAGLDGAYVQGSPLGDRFVATDLTEPLSPLGDWDLAVCLEVAEHLPADRAESFISDLCDLAPLILFSAAIPGQGGAGHVNEQWPAYWVDLFAANDYEVSGALRWRIWTDDRVENWYRQNLMVACHSDDAGQYPDLFHTPLSPMWPVVHPVLFDARRR